MKEPQCDAFSPEERLGRAQDLYRSGDYDRAEAATKSLLEIPSLRPDALYGLGMIYAKREMWDMARTYFERSLELAPSSADAHFQIATLLQSTNPKTAEMHYRKALASRPGFPAALEGLTRLTEDAHHETGSAHPAPTAASGAAPFNHSRPTANGTDRRAGGTRKHALDISGKLLRLVLSSAVFGGVTALVFLSFPDRVGGFGLPQFDDRQVVVAAGVAAALVFLIGLRRALGRSQAAGDPFIEMVESDRDPISAEIAKLLKSVALDRAPALPAFPGRTLVLPTILGICMFVLLIMFPSTFGDVGIPRVGEPEAIWLAAAVASTLALLAIVRILTTRVSIRQGRVRIARGILFRNVSFVELARVTDVVVRRGPWGLITGYATLTLVIGAQAPRTIDLGGLARGASLDALAENIRQTAIALRASRWGRDVLVWR
ncbi:MAG: tetratricopeptide repeat protein [Rhodobacter sp.]|nr:tetratricopeptide repeat protein [Rhodobacter sp.]